MRNEQSGARARRIEHAGDEVTKKNIDFDHVWAVRGSVRRWNQLRSAWLSRAEPKTTPRQPQDNRRNRWPKTNTTRRPSITKMRRNLIAARPSITARATMRRAKNTQHPPSSMLRLPSNTV